MQIMNDMADQKRWVTLMKPSMAMLKFRLPWTKGKTSYFSGNLNATPATARDNY